MFGEMATTFQLTQISGYQNDAGVWVKTDNVTFFTMDPNDESLCGLQSVLPEIVPYCDAPGSNTTCNSGVGGRVSSLCIIETFCIIERVVYLVRTLIHECSCFVPNLLDYRFAIQLHFGTEAAKVKAQS